MSMVSLFAAAVLMISPTGATDPTPRATVEQGVLVGREADGVLSFKGVPYARPPVGELRWRAPRPAEPWSGERDAGQVGAICIQPPANGDNGVGPLPMSEDCLTLNVWAPVDREGPLPVMFWIHGGGLNNGSGTAALYDGTNLAKRGVVVVTSNYRLGRLGFFDHPALAAERADGEPAANYGLMDVILGLRWVQENADAFGGDAGNVTLFGESAGGALVTRLMISEPARGLFHRAVVQSGLGRDEGTPLDDPRRDGGPSMQARGEAFAERPGAQTAEQLRAVPAEDFLRPAPNFYGGDLLVRDGTYVSGDVEAAFAAGREASVPLIIGTNSAEFWWMKPSDLSPYGALDDAMTGDERAALLEAYGGQGGYDAHVLSDLVFNEPARHLARLHARNGHPTYLYRFDVVSAAMPEPHGGATHASERQYVFDNLTASPWPTGEMDQRQADAMAGYWTSFAAKGDPNGDGRQAWPEFGAEPDRLLEFTNDGPAAKPVPFGERLDLIEAYYARVR
ncbi:carboxylesterase family protein [Roseibacterium beibuensis]|uniref:carboxylesterase/lipase family protein n=1 Tax=[Roseibacterium] beibuensis TaxID=1193142 RepID=UPI00217DA14D|nr:carboxylesterase family protein [Roseibacterium beibuensis]MCS6625585.1 carboxylesterase family protein [Roseibacterium beibuensis]